MIWRGGLEAVQSKGGIPRSYVNLGVDKVVIAEDRNRVTLAEIERGGGGDLGLRLQHFKHACLRGRLGGLDDLIPEIEAGEDCMDLCLAGAGRRFQIAIGDEASFQPLDRVVQLLDARKQGFVKLSELIKSGGIDIPVGEKAAVAVGGGADPVAEVVDAAGEGVDGADILDPPLGGEVARDPLNPVGLGAKRRDEVVADTAIGVPAVLFGAVAPVARHAIQEPANLPF